MVSRTFWAFRIAREKKRPTATGIQKSGTEKSRGCEIRMEKTWEFLRILRIPSGNSGWRSEMKNTADLARTFSATVAKGKESVATGGSVSKSCLSAWTNLRISACERVGFRTRKRSPAKATAQTRLPDQTALAETSSKTETALSKRVDPWVQNPIGAEASMTHQTGISRSGTKVFTRVLPLRRLAFQSMARASSVSEYERSHQNSTPSPENTEACLPEESATEFRNLERSRNFIRDFASKKRYRMTLSPIFNPWSTVLPEEDTFQTASTPHFAMEDSIGRPVSSSTKNRSVE